MMIKKSKEQCGIFSFFSILNAKSNKKPQSNARNKNSKDLMFMKMQVYISGLATC